MLEPFSQNKIHEVINEVQYTPDDSQKSYREFK